MKKTRVGVIGAGYLGRFHLEKYAALEEAELVGVAEIRPDRLEEITRHFRIAGFPDFRELLPRVEAVSIVVPTRLHGEIARVCLEQGVDVLIEKPITPELSEAEALIDLARRRNCLIQVGHLERFNPAFLKVRQGIHRPLFIETHRLSPFKERGIDVNVVLDLMIHDLDLILHLTEASPEQVKAVGVPVVSPQVDIANVRLEFADGAVANITASRISVKALRKMRIFQPAAYISLDFGLKSYSLVRLEKAENATVSGMPFVFEEGQLGEQDALELELRAFLLAVQERTVPPVTGEDGARALALALEINREIERNFSKIQASWSPASWPGMETLKTWMDSCGGGEFS
ncbi:MAG: Gfo/Idh/MocA family oxidoreductase [Deltaproteobacteria bacterium]|nr:Gfo/Idh/MocA family oxidoreductase [Deltaproteobacteria bacterium]